jgi:hypothetical protein
MVAAFLATMGTQLAMGQKNYVGIDPFLPLFGTIQPQYERALSPHFSAVIGVGYKSSSGLFEIGGIQTESINLNDFDFQGFKILPELRWYPGQTELLGFYTGIYYKYQSNNSNLTGIYTDDNGSAVSVDLDLELSSNTAGLEVGYKVKAWKGLFLDFIFAGVGLTSHRVSIAENTNLPEEFYRRFSEASERYIVLKDLKPKINLSAQDLDTRVVLPNLRYGLKIGWAF